MSLRSVDLQVALPKVQEAGKTYGSQNQQDTNQQQFAAKFQKQVDHRQKQVQQTQKGEGQKIKRDTHSSGQDGSQSRDKGLDQEHAPDNEQVSAKDPNRGSNIDIRI